MLRRTLVPLLLLTLFLPPLSAAQDTRPGIAVMPFQNGGSYGQDKENFDALERGIAGMLISELSQNPAARVVERENVQRRRWRGSSGPRRLADVPRSSSAQW